LLWNSASITQVGPGNIHAGVPGDLQQAANSIASGNHSMPDALASDAAFKGHSDINVLYVAGNVYDLNYVQQTNVLGDSDFVGLVHQQVLDATSGTDWSIDTGSNALVNTASIVDYDMVGNSTHVGGQIYSDAILIQADLVASHQPNDFLGSVPSGDAIANEAIAFLGEDSAVPLQHEPVDDLVHSHADAPPADIMQSVLA
jgi:hypothetical protein